MRVKAIEVVKCTLLSHFTHRFYQVTGVTKKFVGSTVQNCATL